MPGYRRIADLPWLSPAADIVLVADRSGSSVAEVAATYFAAGAYFQLDRIAAAARRLHRAFAAQRDHEWATDIGGLQPEPSPGVFSTLRGAHVTIWGFGSIGRTLAPHLTALAFEMKLALAEVYEVATFYSHFDVVKDGPPPPAVTVRVCDSLSCAMAGAENLLRELPTRLGGGVRVVRAPCMGACDRAPVWSRSRRRRPASRFSPRSAPNT